MKTINPHKPLPVDINCDMGEGIGNEAALMPFISSANIACGGHAGNEDIMRTVVELTIQHHVAAGAHPSFPDRENFGRTTMKMEPAALYDTITAQLFTLDKIIRSCGTTMKHVKPHGALYNLAARDHATATTIAQAVKDFDSTLVLFGLSGSLSIATAKAMGLKTADEVFADRTYQDDGSLTPRTIPGALITDREIVLQQVMQMINEHTVTSINGKTIPLAAGTVCIHGDGEHAELFAKTIYTAFSAI